MLKEKASTKVLLVKVCAILISGLLISTAMLLNVGTYSWFTDAETLGMRISAVSTTGVIKALKVDNVNPTEIRLYKSDNLESSPVIYFSVEGDAANYIQNINPVKLISGEEYSAAIKVNVGLENFLKLLKNTGNVRGVIKIKYLNEFIDEGRDISFTREFLIEKFLNEIGIEKPIVPGDVSDKTVNSYLTDTIIYIAHYGKWNSVQVPTAGVNSLQEPDFLPEQDKILESIAPGLKSYITGLENQISSRDKELAKRDKQIEELKTKITVLEQSNSQAQQVVLSPTPTATPATP